MTVRNSREVHTSPSAAPRPAQAPTGPLAGIRILAVEQYGAGPLGTMFLADLGAEVVKIEDRSAGGDVSRYIPPGQAGTDSLFFEAFNRNKRSLALDLKNSEGRAVFERLVGAADAVFSNLRGDQPERLGLTYASLGRLNPAIVCVALTAYGRTGAGATLPGYDALIQAEAGWAALTGAPDDPPTKSALSLVDYVAGLISALGMLAAIIDARRTGRGRDVDTNLYDAALSMLTYPATWLLSNGFVTERRALSAHPSVVPFQFFATADGHVAIACPKEKFFRELVTRMDLPELASDARFGSFEARRQNREPLVGRLSARFAELGTDAWLDRLRGRVPIAPVRSLEEALDPAELSARGMLAAYDHPQLGAVRSIGLPLFLGDFTAEYQPGPALGGDGDDVLAETGYSRSEIEALRQAGAFGRDGQPEVAEPA